MVSSLFLVSLSDPDAPRPEGNVMKPTDGGAAVVSFHSHVITTFYTYHRL